MIRGALRGCSQLCTPGPQTASYGKGRYPKWHRGNGGEECREAAPGERLQWDGGRKGQRGRGGFTSEPLRQAGRWGEGSAPTGGKGGVRWGFRPLLTVWLAPHMRTLSSGSEARNSFTFWHTKCFFLVLVLLALSAEPRAAPPLPAADPPAQFEAMAASERPRKAPLPRRSPTSASAWHRPARRTPLRSQRFRPPPSPLGPARPLRSQLALPAAVVPSPPPSPPFPRPCGGSLHRRPSAQAPL